MHYQMTSMFRAGRADNVVIAFSDRGARSPFSVLASRHIPELHLCASTDAFQVASQVVYDSEQGGIRDNITDWALEQFRKHYQRSRGRKARLITKDAIFYYVYAV